CNAVFDADAAALFEKERMKKELAHKEEQIEVKPSENKDKGAKTSALNRVVFPEGKGKEAVVDPKTDSEMFKEDEGMTFMMMNLLRKMR
ncbi:hypothetical protein PIB30_110512, partial [Stylosanthes scabra]|nr:hypothetical protein [Stylosanthes scabra]